MNVWEAIRKKRAIRKFKPESLPEDVIQRILDAGRRSQSSKNSQPWHFIAVQDRERLQKMSQLGDFMGHVAGAALCIAILTPAPGERFAWHMFDIGQSAAYMQLAALEMGVSSCLGTVYKPDEARQILGFPEDRHLTIVISFGYSAETPRPPRPEGRKQLDDVVHWETW